MLDVTYVLRTESFFNFIELLAMNGKRPGPVPLDVNVLSTLITYLHVL